MSRWTNDQLYRKLEDGQKSLQTSLDCLKEAMNLFEGLKQINSDQVTEAYNKAIALGEAIIQFRDFVLDDNKKPVIMGYSKLRYPIDYLLMNLQELAIELHVLWEQLQKGKIPARQKVTYVTDI